MEPPRIEVASGHVAECHFAQDIYEGRLSEPAMAVKEAVLETDGARDEALL